jgi:hypothetical protein
VAIDIFVWERGCFPRKINKNRAQEIADLKRLKEKRTVNHLKERKREAKGNKNRQEIKHERSCNKNKNKLE